ncbi:glutamyl-tRNA synthetase [Arcanobacterium wilhelmae]|uniref:Glutamyl-Q tRNA(Asp) synthetase n=1 Tax=Arcanobacterium wilhelmae TaxID=1803177 RepID=A0ABT9NB31_9ACTO|nr:tRNA glutamyl-Q(34) synthetase GluQRS [Arcanobacterium wilhelmae]MDP9800700.1 glutamyl-tRNA synthetase [Arcanobacterium wilhelmae]WFN90099.1 tRNA glutamyl-Q(34) synthetase GluQRS [Arcanobacterium wilhelmae]
MSGRFAPSPTGDFHLGNLRTALLAWAFARHDGRGFVMRMEDLDERSRPQYVTTQLRDLEAIGLDWDGPVLFQHEHVERYADVAARLLETGALYECYCTRKELSQVASAPHQPPGSYPGTCRHLTGKEREAGRAKLAGLNRGPALRLATDVVELAVTDRQLGAYTGAVDDFVIRRGDGVFSYNFVSVADDAYQGVTQIVRGDDLLPSTPRQVYLQRVLGVPPPEYAHVPLVLNTRGQRLAKRDGAVTLTQLAEFGWGSADVVALLALSLGLPPVRGASEFVQVFDPDALPREPWELDVDALQAGPAAFLG